MAEMTSSPILNEQERAWMSSNTPATEEQVLAWLIEKLTLQGAVGLSTDWLPEQFSSMWDIEVDPSGRISGFTNDESGLRATLNRLNREHARELWLEQVTSHNRALYPRVLTIIESRLLARGIPQERLRALTPRDRLIMLAEVDLPRAPPQPKFTMYLVTAKDATGDTRESTKLFFPYTSTFGHFQCGLRDFTLHSAKRMGRTDGYTLRDGPWIYQLIGPNKAIVPGLPKYSIADETDFREMIRQLRDKDTPMACIFHSLVGKLFEERIKSRAAKAREEDLTVREEEEAMVRYEEQPEVLDENGEPYFGPDLDWKEIVKRVAEGSLKM